ncbi:MAG: zf-HC2 domain-containing protein [Microbacteriaceae bacterium]|nr:zf-HC2 domain-containing protein [Microbacteriaceae bacterium]
MTATDHAHYAEWDAAYVLGALPPGERREFEDHLEDCARCRSAVAELGAVPGLLGRLDDARAFALLDAPGEDDSGYAVPTQDLVARVRARDRSQRIVRGIRVAAGLAAAAVIATVLTLAVPTILSPAPAAEVTAELQPADPDVPVEASVRLTSAEWGTRIEMNCAYHGAAPDPEAGYANPTYAMWVVGRDGSETALSTWTASPGGSVRVDAGTALALADIAEIEVRSATGEQVLLAADLGAQG